MVDTLLKQNRRSGFCLLSCRYFFQSVFVMQTAQDTACYYSMTIRNSVTGDFQHRNAHNKLWQKWEPTKETAEPTLSWRREFLREFAETDNLRKPSLPKSSHTLNRCIYRVASGSLPGHADPTLLPRRLFPSPRCSVSRDSRSSPPGLGPASFESWP